MMHLDSWIDIPEFGEPCAGCDYEPRPGAYVVLCDAHQRIAVVRTPQGYFLPGGGALPGETPAETLRREVYEECGYAITGLRRLGEAVEFVFAITEQRYFRKHGVFLLATLGRRLPHTPEIDHTLLWLRPAEAISRLSHQSHVWVVQRMTCVGR